MPMAHVCRRYLGVTAEQLHDENREAGSLEGDSLRLAFMDLARIGLENKNCLLVKSVQRKKTSSESNDHTTAK